MREGGDFVGKNLEMLKEDAFYAGNYFMLRELRQWQI